MDGGSRGADRREGPEVAGGRPSLHAVGGTPVLHIRRLQGGGDRDRRRAARADGGLCRRGSREGDAGAGGGRADRRARGDQRDQRDRGRAGQQLADRRARRAGAGDALGVGLAAGDRPPALRLAAGQVGGDRQGAGPDRGDDRGGAGPGARRLRAGRPFSITRWTSSSPRPRWRFRRCPPARWPSRPPVSRRRRRCWPRPSGRRSWPAAVCTGATGRGELRALAEALGIPVFLNGLGRGCLPADHELAFSRARGSGPEGCGRGAGGRRADGLPARLRRQLRRGDQGRAARRGSQRAQRQPRARRRPGRRRAGEPGGDPRVGRERGAARPAPGWSSCARSRTRSGRRSRRS